MAVDRLAARRAAQQQENTGYNSNPTQASGNVGYQGYQSRRPNPFAQQDDQPYEMTDVRTPATSGDMKAFSDEILSIEQSINRLTGNVNQINALHSLSFDRIANADPTKLDDLVKETNGLRHSLKTRIQTLEAQVGASPDAQIRRQQVALMKRKFVTAIQEYQKVELKYRERQKEDIRRKYNIVNPGATTEEINNALNTSDSSQIFTQALRPEAYREVQARHQDIQRIEKTLEELAQLFNDMSVLVSQQQETVEAIETQVAAVEHDTEAGLKSTNDAVKSARAARKKRWICFFIIILIVVIIAGTIGGYYASQNKKK